MGRPIKKQTYLGVKAPAQIQATAWTVNSGGPAAGFLTKQNSDERFVATTSAGNATPTLCQLVNTAPTQAGQATVKLFPAVAGGNGAVASANLKVVGANIVSGGTGYSANAVVTLVGGVSGNASTILVNTVNGNGTILTYTVNTVANQQYTQLPPNVQTVQTSIAGHAGATATFNVNFGVESVYVINGGQGYSSNVAATINGGVTDPVLVATATAGAITGITVSSAGTFFSVVPPVAIEDYSGTTEYVKHLAAYRAITYSGNVYRWLAKGVPVPPDYNNINYGFLDTK